MIIINKREKECGFGGCWEKKVLFRLMHLSRSTFPALIPSRWFDFHKLNKVGESASKKSCLVYYQTEHESLGGEFQISTLFSLRSHKEDELNEVGTRQSFFLFGAWIIKYFRIIDQRHFDSWHIDKQWSGSNERSSDAMFIYLLANHWHCHKLWASIRKKESKWWTLRNLWLIKKSRLAMGRAKGKLEMIF